MVKVNDALLVCAFRYALGRATYMVSIVAEELIRLAPVMRAADRELVSREITEREQLGRIGMDVDHAYWMRVRDAMQAVDS